MVLERLESSDPQRALALMGELVPGRDDMHLYDCVFERLAADSPATAVRLADQVAEGAPRSNAIRAVASVWIWSSGLPNTYLGRMWAGVRMARKVLLATHDAYNGRERLAVSKPGFCFGNRVSTAQETRFRSQKPGFALRYFSVYLLTVSTA